MEDLPTPLNRVELYLGTAAQMPGVTPPEEPLSRLEQYLAFIAGDTSIELPAPASLCEQWLAYVAGITPAEPLKLEGAFHVGVQKVDVRFFAAAAGMPGVVAPEPQNRTEQYWARLAEILPVHGVLKNATGTNLTLTDVAWWKMGLERINGDTTQQTYTGKNLFNVADKYGTWASNVSVDSDGWITVTGNTNTFTNLYTNASTNISTSTTYYAVVEVKSVTYDSGTAYLKATSAQATSQAGNASELYLNLISAGETYVLPFETVADFTGTDKMLRTFVYTATAGSSITFRLSVVAVEPNPADFNYEPYVGGVPAPNPNYPQAINTVTGEQTVEIRGKNLLKITEPSSTVADVAFTMNEDGTITLNGTATAASWKNIARDFVSPQMTISNIGVETKSQKVDGWTFSASISNGELQSAVHGSDNGWWAVRLKAGETYNNAILKLQLEQGTTTTEWQPYQEQSYLVGLYGKNMFNKAEAITYKWLNSNTGKLQDSSDPNVVTPYIRVEVGKTYTFSGIGNLQIRVFGYANLTDNKLVTYINNVRDQRTFTAQYPYMRASIGGGNAVAVLDAIQCEEGDTATSFEPYNTIKLCKIGTYQDYIYRSGNDWYVHKAFGKVVLNGTESVWIKSGSTNNTIYVVEISDLIHATTFQNNLGFCKEFKEYTGSYLYGHDIIGFAIEDRNNGNQSARFGLGLNSNITTVDQMKTWLLTNNITLYYVLDSATDTKITNQTLISQLNALDRAVLPQPIAYITASGDLPGELKISYYGEEE